MKFDNDIKILNDKNQHRAELINNMKRELAELDVKRSKISALNISGEAKAKIDSVYNFAVNTARERVLNVRVSENLS